MILVFFSTSAQACRTLCQETLHGADAKVKHRLVPAHGFGKELHGLLCDAVCASEAAGSRCLLAVALLCSHLGCVALRMTNTDPFQQRGPQHPTQEPLFSDPNAKALNQLLACALRALVALAENVGELLVLWQVLHHSFRGAFHNELGHDGACHGHDRDISLVSGTDEPHPSVLLRPRPTTVPQAQELRCRLVHVHDARRCTPYSVTWYIKRNRNLSTCVSTNLGSVIFLVPPAMPVINATEEVEDPSVAESARHAVLLGHSVENGLHHRRGNRDACLPNAVTLLSQTGNDRIDNISWFAAFLLVLVQPSSQCPH